MGNSSVILSAILPVTSEFSIGEPSKLPGIQLVYHRQGVSLLLRYCPDHLDILLSDFSSGVSKTP